jgi:hypothetical protein
MDILNSIFDFIQKNLIALISLIVSFFVAYKNLIKPFRLNVRYRSNDIFWVLDGYLRADFSLSFFNSGIREGVIENLSFTIQFLKKNATFDSDFYYRLTTDAKLVLDGFWVPIFLKGKETISKTVGFKSDIKLEDANDENIKMMNIEIPVVVNIQEAINRSKKNATS